LFKFDSTFLAQFTAVLHFYAFNKVFASEAVLNHILNIIICSLFAIKYFLKIGLDLTKL